MRRVSQMLSILSAAVAAVGEAAAQPADLPPDPTGSWSRTNARLATTSAWCSPRPGSIAPAGAQPIDEMMSYGLRVTPDEQARILEYLATYLGPAAPEPAKQ